MLKVRKLQALSVHRYIDVGIGMYDIYTCVCMLLVLFKARKRKELYGYYNKPLV